MIFEMGAKLEGDEFDTSKADKKKKKIEELLPKKEHQLVFTYEKRRGKAVTLVGSFYIEQKEKKELLNLLKKSLACGGTIKDEYLELQGEVKKRVKEVLQKEGWKFKK